jgi:hypothetical protein
VDVCEAKRLKQLEDENAKLKKLLAEAMLDASALRELLSKKIVGPAAEREGVVTYNFVAGKPYGRAEIYIHRGDKEQSDLIFDRLFEQKNAIETAFGGLPVWEMLHDKRANRIKAGVECNLFEPAQWPAMIDFMVNAMVRLEAAFPTPLSTVVQAPQIHSAH